MSALLWQDLRFLYGIVDFFYLILDLAENTGKMVFMVRKVRSGRSRREELFRRAAK